MLYEQQQTISMISNIWELKEVLAAKTPYSTCTKFEKLAWEGKVYYTVMGLLPISFVYRSTWLLGCVLNGTHYYRVVLHISQTSPVSFLLRISSISCIYFVLHVLSTLFYNTAWRTEIIKCIIIFSRFSHFHPVPRSRQTGAVCPLNHTPSWCGAE
jgi:hypothetical protein